MKRLAVWAMAAGVGWASAGRAADPLPPPTGVVVAQGTGAGAVQLVNFNLGPRVGGLLKGGVVGDVLGRQKWCEDCAPAVRHPLPPLPPASDCGRTRCAAPGAGGGGCAEPARPCWERFKEWFCYRQTPVHLGYVPTQRDAPQYTQFHCAEKPGCLAGGCGSPGHGCAIGSRLFGGKAAGAACTTCPTPGEGVMPGFRFANPGAAATTTAPAVASPDLLPAAFRTPQTPSPTVPYATPAGGNVRR